MAQTSFLKLKALTPHCIGFSFGSMCLILIFLTDTRNVYDQLFSLISSIHLVLFNQNIAIHETILLHWNIHLLGNLPNTKFV